MSKNFKMKTSLFQIIGRIILGTFMTFAGVGHLTSIRKLLRQHETDPH